MIDHILNIIFLCYIITTVIGIFWWSTVAGGDGWIHTDLNAAFDSFKIFIEIIFLIQKDAMSRFVRSSSKIAIAVLITILFLPLNGLVFASLIIIFIIEKISVLLNKLKQ